MQKTYSAKPCEITRQWWLIDAENLVLGRLASVVAKMLKGKHKPTYTPNQNCGDHIVIINADKIQLTGKKYLNKQYYWHTGYPGGIKNRNARQILEGNHPQRVIEYAVERMLSRGPLQRDILNNLHIYAGSTHKHQGQTPQVLDVASLNRKNTKTN
jgi:large subunit ribosomal protein L13